MAPSKPALDSSAVDNNNQVLEAMVFSERSPVWDSSRSNNQEVSAELSLKMVD